MDCRLLQSTLWEFKFSQEASDQFDSLDHAVQARIKKKILSIINSKTNPTTYFKRLTGNLNHLYSLRVGDYRLICQIKNDRLVILALHVSHRKDVYNT